MKAIECRVVDCWLKRGHRHPPEAALHRVSKTRFSIDWGAIVCCSENIAGQARQIVTSVDRLVSCAHAVHGLAMRYYSGVPRFVTIRGAAVQRQLFFIGKDGLESHDFVIEGHTHDVVRYGTNASRCCELHVKISRGSPATSLDETIEGFVTVSAVDRDGYLAKVEEEAYQIRLVSA